MFLSFKPVIFILVAIERVVSRGIVTESQRWTASTNAGPSSPLLAVTTHDTSPVFGEAPRAEKSLPTINAVKNRIRIVLNVTWKDVTFIKYHSHNGLCGPAGAQGRIYSMRPFAWRVTGCSNICGCIDSKQCHDWENCAYATLQSALVIDRVIRESTFICRRLMTYECGYNVLPLRST